MRILLVDDSRLMRIMNERALVKAGHTVITAADGEQGLMLAREREPDVIVLDMMLPKLSGVDVLHALRKESKTATVPVLVLTSLPQMNADTLIHEGATAYFEKSLLNTEGGVSGFIQAVTDLAKSEPASARVI